jgi:heat shock protein HslJ
MLAKKEFEMKQVIPILFILLFGVLFTACQPVTEPEVPGTGQEQTDIENTNWLVSTLDQESLIEGTTITAQFTGTEIVGDAGCNSYTASYQAEGNNFTVGEVIQTEIACMEPPGVMEQEQRYLQILREVSSYQRTDGDQLRISDQAGNVRLVMTRVP